MPGPSFDNQQTGQEWWDTYEQMQSFDWTPPPSPSEDPAYISQWTDFQEDVWNMGYSFWENQLSPYIGQDETDVGISPLSLLVEYGESISPFGMNPISYEDIGSKYDISRDVTGTQFSLNKNLESKAAGSTGLSSVGSRSNLYDDYISDITQLSSTTEDEYGSLFSSYGTTFSTGVDSLIDIESGGFGSGDWSDEEGGAYIDVPESMQEITDILNTYTPQPGQPNTVSYEFQECVSNQMIASNDFTPEGFQQGASICWETTQGDIGGDY